MSDLTSPGAGDQPAHQSSSVSDRSLADLVARADVIAARFDSALTGVSGESPEALISEYGATRDELRESVFGACVELAKAIRDGLDNGSVESLVAARAVWLRAPELVRRWLFEQHLEVFGPLDREPWSLLPSMQARRADDAV